MSAADVTSRDTTTRELEFLIKRLRRRLGREQALRFGLRGAAGSLLVALVIEVGSWTGALTPPNPVAVTLVALPLCLALGLSLLRWPSQVRAARIADERLGLEERLGTAVELLGAGETPRYASRLGPLQLHDALSAGAPAAARWPSPLARARRELLIVAVLGVLVLGGLLLRPVSSGSAPAAQAAAQSARGAPQQSHQAPPAAATPPAATSPMATARAQPTAAVPTPAEQSGSSQSPSGTPGPSDSAQQALDRLGQALQYGSATQGAADSIARGDYQGAADQLTQLGENADQLSQAAKQQLARNLQSAANDTGTYDPALAQAERQAARALAAGSYDQQQQALQGLGQEAARQGDSASQAAQSPSGAGGQQGAGQPGAGGTQPSAGGGQGQQGTGAKGAGNGGSAGGAGQGSQGDGSAGTSPNGPQSGGQSATSPPGGAQQQLPGGQPQPLDAAGQPVEVPSQLNSDQTAGTASGDVSPVSPPAGTTSRSADQAGGGAGGRSAAAAPESNDVPGDRRQVVSNYFDGEGGSGTSTRNGGNR